MVICRKQGGIYMSPFAREIYRQITKSEEPISIEELYKKTILDNYIIKQSIDELVKNKLVDKIKINNKIYYKLVSDSDEKKLKEVKENLVADTVIALDEVDELREKIKVMDSNINLIYINIITVIALFISIFSIITINTNTISELVKTLGKDAIKSIVLVNLSMVVSIGIMLFMLKYFIINSLNKKK